jgi:hypothetical protein
MTGYLQGKPAAVLRSWDVHGAGFLRGGDVESAAGGRRPASRHRLRPGARADFGCGFHLHAPRFVFSGIQRTLTLCPHLRLCARSSDSVLAAPTLCPQLRDAELPNFWPNFPGKSVSLVCNALNFDAHNSDVHGFTPQIPASLIFTQRSCLRVPLHH